MKDDFKKSGFLDSSFVVDGNIAFLITLGHLYDSPKTGE